jgi:hypothetical protein
MCADASSAEFREVRISAIELRDPLKIRLSLFAIPDEAVSAFQDICREIIVSRDRRADPLAGVATIVDRVLQRVDAGGRVTVSEAQRLRQHIVSLHNAEVRLKHVAVRDA